MRTKPLTNFSPLYVLIKGKTYKNKSLSSYPGKDPRPCLGITGYIVHPHLDRIKLSVYGNDAETVFSRLVALLSSSPWCRRENSKGSLRFASAVSSVSLFQVPPSLFTIQICDPTPETQCRVLDALRSASLPEFLSDHADSLPFRTSSSVMVSFSEAEFALDFYPDRSSDLYRLLYALRNSVVLKHTRTRTFGCYGETFYQGLKGSVRAGSKGLRCYLTEQKAIRVELQCNRSFLRRHRLTLPISVDAVNVWDFIEFRRPAEVDSLTNAVCKKKRPHSRMWPEHRRTAYRDAVRNVLMKQIHDAMVSKVISDDPMASDRTGEYPEYSFSIEDIPVSIQVDVFRDLKKQYHLTHQMGQFFPMYKREV
jgi:hypothetical protein